MEERNESGEYRDTVNLTYISNIAQLERQLQAIELSYMTDKGILEPLDAVVLTNAINGTTVSPSEDRDVVEDPRPPSITRLKSVTRGVYKMIKSDIGLILLLICYMALGAVGFWAIEERTSEEVVQKELNELRRILADIRIIIHSNPLQEAPDMMPFDVDTGNGTSEGNATRSPERGDIQEQMVDALIKCHDHVHEFTPAPKKQMLWSFWGAMYFCVTVFTTVGKRIHVRLEPRLFFCPLECLTALTH